MTILLIIIAVLLFLCFCALCVIAYVGLWFKRSMRGVHMPGLQHVFDVYQRAKRPNYQGGTR